MIMKKILQKTAHIIRGLFYYPLYYFRFRVLMPSSIKNSDHVVTVKVEDISYKLRVHVAEGGLAEDLYICGIREFPNVYYFKKYATTNAKRLSTYIDVGSNIGYYAFLARNVFKKAKSRTRVYAVEPVRSTYERLLENVRLNGAREMKTINVGVGDRDGMADMAVMKQKNLSIMADAAKNKQGDIEKIEKIPLVSLKTFFDKNKIPRKDVFLRCDIEGYEYKLIVGNIKFLSTLKNAHIVMEFHPFYLHAKKSVQMLRALQKAGYALDQVVSCEVLYFLMMPKVIRTLLIKLFLFQYDGDALGKIDRYRTIDDLIRDIRNEKNVLYFYPNLHFYFSKK